MQNNRWTWVALLGLGLVGLVLFLNAQFPGAVQDQDSRMRLVYSLVLLAVIGGSVALGWRERAGVALKQAMAWVALTLVLVVGYSYRDAFEPIVARTAQELVPTRPVEESYGVVSLSSDRSGHFNADAAVNGTHVRFLVDTGASDVALSRFDAKRVGIDTDSLRYTIPYNTANGVAYGARVRLDRVSIGSIELENVAASVASEGLDRSLLGMSFLGRLSQMEVSGDRLILRE